MDRASFLKRVTGAGALLFLPDWSATGQELSAGDAPITLTPVKEGAALRTISIPVTFEEHGNILIGFRRVVTEQYPLLYKATREMGQAFSPKVEWLVKDWRGKLHVEHNYTQIFRTPFGITGSEIASLRYGTQAEKRLIKLRKDALAKHLEAVEHVLAKDKRSDNGMVRTMGGVKEFKGNRLTLRSLRDLHLLTNRQANDMDMYQEEFLSEVSLQVSR